MCAIGRRAAAAVSAGRGVGEQPGGVGDRRRADLSRAFALRARPEARRNPGSPRTLRIRTPVRRAGAIPSPQFTVTDQNAPALASVCSRLDGIPLALELAAARLRALSVEEVAARLDDRFRLLTGGSRTALPRQQTLRSLIDWSYDLLGDSEQVALPAALGLRRGLDAGGSRAGLRRGPASRMAMCSTCSPRWSTRALHRPKSATSRRATGCSRRCASIARPAARVRQGSDLAGAPLGVFPRARGDAEPRLTRPDQRSLARPAGDGARQPALGVGGVSGAGGDATNGGPARKRILAVLVCARVSRRGTQLALRTARPRRGVSMAARANGFTAPGHGHGTRATRRPPGRCSRRASSLSGSWRPPWHRPVAEYSGYRRPPSG